MDLSNIETIIKLDKELDLYLKFKTGGMFPVLFKLENCFINYKDKENFTKLIAASFDFKVNLVMLSCELYKFGGLSNENKEFHNIDIISNELARNFKLDFHSHYTNFIFKYRAIIDKYMGLVIMILRPEKYDKFISATSRKSEYQKMCKEIGFSESYINTFNEVLTKFDNKLRTPEAHSTGRIRKYTLSDNYDIDEIFNIAFCSWNMLISLLSFCDEIKNVDSK